jgi:hypothetical protein
LKSIPIMKHPTDGQSSSGIINRAGTILLSLSCLGALALVGGCASEPASHVVSAPPPAAPAKMVSTTTTTTTPASMVVATSGNVTTATPVGSTIVVTQTPPVPQAEAVTPQPSTLHAWIPGYWTWRNERYEWLAGHWELPPRSSAVWVAPRWEQEGNAYRFYEGFWRY